MKKHTPKHKGQTKTRIQLKIKSNTVTNNFILTPRTVSPRGTLEHGYRTDRVIDDSRSQRQRYEASGGQYSGTTKGNEHKRAITDNVKGKKKAQEDTTGTQTPFPKRASATQEGFHKKKSLNSLLSSEKTKHRKKTGDKLSKNLSGQINPSTFQRVLGLIIKDYKEGKLKEKQLKETLLQLYERKEKQKSACKRKKKELNRQSFSNQFLKSAVNQTRSQGLARRRILSNEVDITERVLQKEGFINKIIVKGITTSMFLKDEEEDSPSLVKDHNKIQKAPIFNINTSNSVKQLNEDIRNLTQQYKGIGARRSVFTYEDIMAAKIQRAWRKYRTKLIVKNVAFCHSGQNVFNILDDFTDEQDHQHTQSPIDKLSRVTPISPKEEGRSYTELAQIVLHSLREANLSKEECLKHILQYLDVPVSEFKPGSNKQIPNVEWQIQQQKQYIVFEGLHQDLSQEQVIESRIKMIQKPSADLKAPLEEAFQQTPSNELELNSFTNKYSSKEGIQNVSQFYKGKSIIEQSQQELDKSLTFVHSQTLTNQSFKMVNIRNIQQGLDKRQEHLSLRKQKQMSNLTQKLFNNRVTKDEYLREKATIQKWFKSQLKEMKRIKNVLFKSCNQACKILQSENTLKLKNQKSNKMLKCLSQRYVKNKEWAFDRTKALDLNNGKRKKDKGRCQVQLQGDIETKSYQLSGANDSDEGCEPFVEATISAKKCEMSPKIAKFEDGEEQLYKFEQVENIIQEQDQGLQGGMIDFQIMPHKMSEQFEISPTSHEKDQGSDQASQHQISLINNFVNKAQNNRFKYLCLEDKQDIFEFLFLDLVLEMFTETMAGQHRVLRAAETYINRVKRLKSIPKGIKTSIAASKQYLTVLSKYVLQQKKGLKNLSHPMGPSAFEMLKYMRDEIVQADDEEAISSTLVLPIEVFQKVSRLPQLELNLEKYYQDEEKQYNRLHFLRTALNINNKSLFDCINELLDQERPYGVWGKPFPWKKVISVDRQWSKADQEKKLKKCYDRTIQNCSYLCGILVDKQDSLFGNHRVSEDYVLQIREDRLSKMLANELIQNEERWIFYDDEETEIMMQVSSYITKKLIKEIVLEMKSIEMKL